jgi:hypothetical protein
MESHYYELLIYYHLVPLFPHNKIIALPRSGVTGGVR